MEYLPDMDNTDHKRRCRMVPLGLEPSGYELPADREAKDRLSRYSELRAITSRFISDVAEPWITSRLLGSSIEVSPRQFPELYTLVSEIAAILSVPAPSVYIQAGPIPNAFTHGTGSVSFLVIAHSLVEQLNNDELAFVVGHEMGHIKSEHISYMTLAHWLLEDESRRQKLSEEAVLSLLDWMRNSELSADRAGLVVCQDVDAASRALLTMAIGSRKLATRVDIMYYVDSQNLSLEFNPASEQFLAYQTHPFMPDRIKHLIEYYSSKEYADLFSRALTLG